MGERRDTPAPPVPEPVVDEDTGRLSVHMVDVAAGATSPMRATNGTVADQFLDAVAGKLAEKIGGGGGGEPPQRRVFGMSGGDWTKMILTWIIAAVVFVGTWYMSVRDGLRDRPTHDMVEKRLREHAGDIHPEASRQIDAVRREQRVIRESQIRQEQVDLQQTETLKEIKTELQRRRR